MGQKAILYLLFFLLASKIPSPESPRHTSHHTQLFEHQQYEQFQYFLHREMTAASDPGRNFAL